jgi:hypothetical protein
MDNGVDEAWARLTPAQAKAAGKQFVVGYVSEDPSKNLTLAEVQAYHAAGIAVLLVYEYNTAAAETGANGGHKNATLAAQLAKALGYPPSCAIAFAIDEPSPNLGMLSAYAAAFTAVCHAAGYSDMVYGGYSTVKYCLDHALVDLGWQTYAWSNGQWDTRAVLRQVQNDVTIAGVSLDLDTATTANYGAWMPGDIVTEPVIIDLSGTKWTNSKGEPKGLDEFLVDVYRAVFSAWGEIPGTLAAMQAKIDKIGVTASLTDAQIATIATQVSAAIVQHHDALTTADEPFIVEAVVSALKAGIK